MGESLTDTLPEGVKNAKLDLAVIESDDKEDSATKWGQFILGFVLIGSCMAFIGYFTLVKADLAFQLELAGEIKVLLIIAAGAALGKLGLGRAGKRLLR